MAQDDTDNSADQRLREVIKGSGELIGAVAGGALGLVGGPVGAMGGAAAGLLITRTVRRVGLEVYDRLLVPRQQERVGTVLAVALADAEARGIAGEQPRADGFFDAPEGNRSDAEEILEGVLLQAANAYQERKLRHLGAILPSLAFRSDVSPADGHWLSRMADRLSWRQLVLLAIFADPPEEQLLRRDVDQDEGGTDGPSAGLREETEELGTLGLMGVTTGDGDVVRAGATWGSTGSIWGTPTAHWRLTAQGRLLVEVANLDAVTPDERAGVLADLLE
jgi:hypothetical protein